MRYSYSILDNMALQADEKISDGSTNSRNALNEETALDSPRQALDTDPVYSYREQRKIIHRIDRRLVITCGIIYCFSLIDRGNLGNASIAGMTKDLELNVGFRYSTIVLVFFPTYVLFQPPATLLSRKLGPRKFLATITLLWGTLEIGFGFAKKWTDMIGLRVALGILEAGLYPSVVYLLATWYSRYDVGKRYCAFYVVGCLALAFGGILAYGLMQMDGLHGMRGWRWIFIMEGVFTCLCSFFAYFLLVDFPDKADQSWRFLNRDERDFIVRRINKDRDDAIPEKFTLARFLRPALDIKIWILAFISFLIITVTTSISVFLPIILRNGLGFTIAESQCLIAPPYCLAAILMVTSAYLGDRFHVRGPILIFNSLVALVGLPIMGFASSSSARYFGVFLVTAGTNANIPTALAYQANNVRGQWKRALTSALFVGCGGIGGISGGTIFRSQDAPRYIPGISAAIACNCLVVVCVLGLSGYYMYANKQADRGKKVLEGSEAFRYTI
ncbi:MAG: hypothetical protein LQ349_004789 [Xanthoria aureola]|nr:MAG: hypothetical protein LQ349_004789 [Xanthoria aureola]